MTRINTLQAGRALAALAVVLHHAELAAHDFATASPFHDIFVRGYLGVDFFFVLSGFIIFHTNVGRSETLSDYALKRIRRVFVPYLPVGVGMALLYTLLPSLSAGTREWSWLPTLTLLPVTAEPALAVAWTLKHELVFYALFGLFYFGGLLWLGLATWMAAILLIPSSPIPLASINLEFLMGIAAAVAFRRGWESPWLLVGTAVSFVAWGWLGGERESSVLVGLGIAFALPVLIGWERKGGLHVPAALIFLGEASYAIYLVHVVPIAAMSRLFATWPGIIGAGVLASVAGGIAYYLVIERPLLRALSPKGKHRRAKAVAEEPAVEVAARS